MYTVYTMQDHVKQRIGTTPSVNDWLLKQKGLPFQGVIKKHKGSTTIIYRDGTHLIFAPAPIECPYCGHNLDKDGECLMCIELLERIEH